LRKTNKEDNTMKKKMSTFEKVFREEGRVEGREEGEVKGIEKTIRNFIERKRNRHVSEEQIHEELLLDFGLDAAKARQYMEPSLAKA
jgi:predicted transposase YdaD